MKLYILKQRIFESLMVILLLLPPISFVLYAFFGFFFNFNTFNFIIYICFIIFACSNIRHLKNSHAKFFIQLGVILCLCLCGHIINQGITGVYDFMRTISGYYVFVFIGWCMYKLYFEKNQVNTLLKLIVRCGIFIAIINWLHYFYLITDNYIVSGSGWSVSFDRYDTMVQYLGELNKTFYDYILIGLNYDNALRPVGYFYDTHAQYYTPLATCIILFFNKTIIHHSRVWLSIILFSIVVSSIKTAFLTIVILAAIWIWLNMDWKRIFKYAIPIILGLSVILYKQISAMLMGDNMTKILFQLITHIIIVPYQLISTYIVGFFLGGVSFLRDDPAYYSEVFWVTVLFYIGVLGLIIYLKPIKLLRHMKNGPWELGAYLYIMMALSLTHYGVYVVGFNNMVSALPFMFYFGLISHNNKPNK